VDAVSLPEPTQSAVVVVVPEAEPVVGTWRARHDKSAGWGVPAHVTVLYPFLPPERIDTAVLGRLATVVSGVNPFETTFGATGWFGEEVVYLVPEPHAADLWAFAKGQGAKEAAQPWAGHVHARGSPTARRVLLRWVRDGTDHGTQCLRTDRIGA
jgi:hypothetical protein